MYRNPEMKIGDLVVGDPDESEPTLYALDSLNSPLTHVGRLRICEQAIIVQGCGRVVVLTSKGLFATFQSYFVKA